MTEECNASEGYRILKAAGFETDHLNHFMYLSIDFDDGGDGRPETTILRVGAPGPHVIMDAALSYRVVASSSSPECKHVEFDTDDARDVVALVVSLRNENLVATGKADEIPEGDGFTAQDDDLTFIWSAFCGGDYADYVLDRKPTTTGIHLADPKQTYGKAYVEWRNAKVDRLLREAVEPSPGA